MYSVIIPSIGRLDFLNELLNSIFIQSLKPKEVLLLLEDNLHCREISKKLHKAEKCKIVYCKNLNLAQMRNYGASLANSDFLLYSDDDDIWNIDKAKYVIESLKYSQVVTHDFTKFGSKTQKQRYLLGRFKKKVSLSSLIQGTNIYGGGSSICVRKNILSSIPFNKDLNYCEDYEWWTRLLIADVKIEYIPKPLVKYRTHNKNMTSRIFITSNFKLMVFLKLFQKGVILLIGSSVFFVKTLISLAINIIFLNFRK